MIMKINDEIKKEYENFTKAFENLKTTEYVPEPHSVISQTGIIGLFHVCCDCAYLFIKNYLECQGYIFPVTAFPQTIIKTACQVGIIDNEDMWIEILETRNSHPRTYDEAMTMKTIETIELVYIPAFETLNKNIADRWLKPNLK